MDARETRKLTLAGSQAGKIYDFLQGEIKKAALSGSYCVHVEDIDSSWEYQYVYKVSKCLEEEGYFVEICSDGIKIKCIVIDWELL